MDWIQTGSIIAAILIRAYYIHIDITNNTKSQSTRTDRLYERFMDLLKENGETK